VSCDPDYAGFDRPPYVPTTRAIEDAWRAKARGYAEDCGANNGPILDHLTTIDSAKDMNSIRKSLGVKQINYYGFSYGTYLGQVFATLYPDNMRRVVFDGTVDPTDVWYDANLNQGVAFDRNINIWFDWIARHDDTYHLGSTAKAVNKLFYATQKELYASPAVGSLGKLGGSEWTDAFLYAGYYQSTWTELAQTFADFIHNNDVDALQSAYLDASGFGNDNGYAVYLGVECTDVQWPTKWSTWRRDNWRIYHDAPFETWGNAWYNAPCINWPAPANRHAVKVSGKRVKSLLMINETLDAATPYAGSLTVRRLFPAASLIAVPGGTTHANSLNGNACVDDHIADYLLDGTLPKRKNGNRADAECAPLPQPAPAALAKQKTAAPDNGSITRWDLQKISAG
jgi:pimeloyl-ACP methyl ester carboxylesterase